MRILLVHNFYRFPGGEDTVFLNEGSLLRRNGHVIMEYREENQRIAHLNPGSLAVETLWSASSRREIRRVVREHNIEVVHFHNTFPLVSPSAYYGCSQAGAAVVQTLHNFRLLCPSATLFRNNATCEDCMERFFPWPSIVHACYHDSRAATSVVAAMLSLHRFRKTWEDRVDGYIALTEFARRKLIAGGLPSRKIAVKPNFVYPDPGPSLTHEGYALYVGRLSPEKGIFTLLQAWQQVKSFPLKIVGSGPLLERVRHEVRARDLAHIDVLGQLPREQVLRLMRNASFVVVPSTWYEAFPLVIAEAFACGKPVIASRIGGMVEIVQEGINGFLFEPGVSVDLARIVGWCRDHPLEVQNLGARARKAFEAQYTADANYGRLIHIYEQALAEKEKRTGRLANEA